MRARGRRRRRREGEPRAVDRRRRPPARDLEDVRRDLRGKIQVSGRARQVARGSDHQAAPVEDGVVDGGVAQATTVRPAGRDARVDPRGRRARGCHDGGPRRRAGAGHRIPVTLPVALARVARGEARRAQAATRRDAVRLGARHELRVRVQFRPLRRGKRVRPGAGQRAGPRLSSFGGTT